MNTNIVAENRGNVKEETAWGAILDPAEDALYLAGYRAFVADGSLFVRKPNGDRYMVNPYRGTCSCPARDGCKHKANLVSLVFLSMDELFTRGKWDAYDALCDYWFAYTSHRANAARQTAQEVGR